VVHTKKDETIRAMVGRLLDKRGLKYTSFDVFKIDQPEKPLDLSANCSILAYTEVRIEPRVLFRLVSFKSPAAVQDSRFIHF